MRFLIFLLITYFLSLTTSFALGQAGLDLPALGAGVGARPLGMGGAFSAIADNADAPFYGPAGLGFNTRQSITTMQTRLSTDADHYYLSYIVPAFGGTVGLSWVQIGISDIAQTSNEVDVHNEVQNISLFSYYSSAYLLAYGRKFNDHISFGLTAKYLTSDMFGLAGGQAWGYSLTPNILFRVGDLAARHLSVGFKVDELVNYQKWGTETIEQVPAKARLGLALYQVPMISGTAAIDISQMVKSGYSPEVATGYEWSERGLSFRAGYNAGGLTTGVGFRVGHASVDYSCVLQRELSRNNVHRVSLTGTW
ncbi:hypothetical protein A3K48_03395 [candidate division WOR-1 bacterium RIFOXYA12_FULL_52_29]|uniref:PorV/PorQ family protein n=1 Tax=candidate division WOR-1 bacterium RIFOXYC12_FULL_54_18 TaxID=1802584 RepID=A0A1F4T644_UNCSA|nr:MAG: hypothetical protein A3K44_03395 [candidate division WOR-1 bacterium RIFOXYA2_FULL_51_19]OGC17610.1 MAG: hypothetical protein A3K48_03395 [candidate division WOR-1 bacterium RIFOXYA12_FULL_52_29]OGC26467.1 MAG: hypothetical protein A3K32_03390 [candidate division WOR-1 bacterium RIFOXYB2_FULL_45_9]OGC28027.1 MAG: hypothetical protein A3K49_03395 [candidate division WOR-1 bacterium RIFOXYC12_FULL_54_18]OGC29687.1 MAG: hypothetical protein A2346_02940 [candidate division WOR-1 bacterium R